MVSISAFETSMFISEQSNITIIGTLAFLQASKLPGSSNFKLCLCSLDIQVNFTKLAEAPDLSNVSSKYYEFTNIFSKTKAEVLASYHPYNFQINLEKGVQPLVGPIYSLSTFEQEALKKFIEENLNMGFIRPTSSPYGTLVLSRRKIVHYVSMSTSAVLTVFPKRTAIHSCSSLIYWTYLTKYEYIQK